MATLSAIGQAHRRTVGDRERARNLENENRGGVALSVEVENACQPSRRRETVNAWRERRATQIHATLCDIARHACQEIVRSGEISLSLSRDGISGVNLSSGWLPHRKPGDRGTRAHTHISADGSRAGIGDG
jgi:hypothetical protein